MSAENKLREQHKHETKPTGVYFVIKFTYDITMTNHGH